MKCGFASFTNLANSFQAPSWTCLLQEMAQNRMLAIDPRAGIVRNDARVPETTRPRRTTL